MKLTKFFLICLISLLLITGCGGSSDNGFVNDEFSDSTAEKVDSSIITLPRSISGAPAESSRSLSRSLTRDSGADGLLEIYSGIREYIGMAEMIKDFAKGIIKEIIPALRHIPVGEEITIPADPNDPGAPKRVLVEKTDGETYEWKISCFFTEDATAAELIVRMTVEEAGVKGRILMTRTEDDDDSDDLGLDVETSFSVDVTFDGTAGDKTLEVKFVQENFDRFIADASAAIAASSIVDKSGAIERLIGRPAKVFLNAVYDASDAEYTVYGTSYHPGWDDIPDRGLDLGDGRSMYMFKAKAKEGETNGAKLYLAIPLETRDTITDVWEDDSIGAVVPDVLLDMINGMIAESDHRDHVMMMLLGLTPSLDDYESGVSQEDFDAFVEWAADSTDANIQTIATWPLNTFNKWYTDLPDATQAQVLYTLLYEPTILPAIIEHGYTMDATDMDAFMELEDIPSGAEEFNTLYSSISYLVNPAFYTDEAGFLGTCSCSDDATPVCQFYQYGSGVMSPADPPGVFDVLNALDLSAIDPYVPSVVKDAVIQVE